MSVSEKETKDKIIFAITEGYLQSEAQESIGRELNEDEVLMATKWIEEGIMSGIDIIFQTIFTELIPSQNTK